MRRYVHIIHAFIILMGAVGGLVAGMLLYYVQGLYHTRQASWATSHALYQQEIIDIRHELDIVTDRLQQAELALISKDIELQQYKDKLAPLTEEDWNAIHRLSSYIQRNINKKINSKDAIRAAAACVVAGKYTVLSVYEVTALVHTESTFYLRSVSSAKCRGLAQISSKVWKLYSQKLGLHDHSIDNPIANTIVGATYLADLRESYSGDWQHALQFYNAGSNFNKGSLNFARVVQRRAIQWEGVF